MKAKAKTGNASHMKWVIIVLVSILLTLVGFQHVGMKRLTTFYDQSCYESQHPADMTDELILCHSVTYRTGLPLAYEGYSDNVDHPYSYRRDYMLVIDAVIWALAVTLFTKVVVQTVYKKR